MHRFGDRAKEGRRGYAAKERSEQDDGDRPQPAHINEKEARQRTHPEAVAEGVLLVVELLDIVVAAKRNTKRTTQNQLRGQFERWDGLGARSGQDGIESAGEQRTDR